jgi:diphosphomevalonate decarboxylase
MQSIERKMIATKADVVSCLLSDEKRYFPRRKQGVGFAPTNIALCKYWGKRDVALNLPTASSLSIALPDRGARTTLSLSTEKQDVVILNGKRLPDDHAFVIRLVHYLDLFQMPRTWYLTIDTVTNIPVAAGFASSAAGFAALVLGLNELFDWQCSLRELSILARLGSGSAARSFWPGFVEWHRGCQADGMDSYAEPLLDHFPGLHIGLLICNANQKPLSSTEAMQQTMQRNALYQYWPDRAAKDLTTLKLAIQQRDFDLFGATAESNALMMHALMLTSSPPICYILPETLAVMHRVWALRREGVPVYFTEDAGPNLKLLFLEADLPQAREAFPRMDVLKVG